MTLEEFRQTLAEVLRLESRNQAQNNGINHEHEFGAYRLNAGRCQGLMLAADIVERYGRDPSEIDPPADEQEASNG